ncbi:MAG: hypothetical protein ABH864_05670 [archaeon]
MQQTPPSSNPLIFGETDPVGSTNVTLTHYHLLDETTPDVQAIMSQRLFAKDGTPNSSFHSFFEQLRQIPPGFQHLKKPLIDFLANKPHPLEELFDLNPTRFLDSLVRNSPFSPLIPRHEKELLVQTPTIVKDIHVYVGQVGGELFVFEHSDSMSKDNPVIDLPVIDMWREFIWDYQASRSNPPTSRPGPLSVYCDTVVERIKSGELEKYLVRDENGNPDVITFEVPRCILKETESAKTQPPASQPAGKSSLDSLIKHHQQIPILQVKNPQKSDLSESQPVYSTSQPIKNLDFQPIPNSYKLATSPTHQVLTTQDSPSKSPIDYQHHSEYSTTSTGLCLCALVFVAITWRRRNKQKGPRITLEK